MFLEEEELKSVSNRIIECKTKEDEAKGTFSLLLGNQWCQLLELQNRTLISAKDLNNLINANSSTDPCFQITVQRKLGFDYTHYLVQIAGTVLGTVRELLVRPRGQ